MSLKTFVKVGSISNLSDARYCAGMGVDVLGFSSDESKLEYIDPEEQNQIRNWVSGVNIVLETDIIDVSDEYFYDYLEYEIHSDNLYLLNQITSKKHAIKVSIEDIKHIINDYNGNPEYILVELKRNLSKDQINQVQFLSSSHRVLIHAPSLSPETIFEDLKTTKAEGIGLYGSEEERPGFKNYDELADLLEVLEDD